VWRRVVVIRIKNHSATIKDCSMMVAKGLSMRVVVIKNHRGAIKDLVVRARVGAKYCSLTAKLGVVTKNLSLMATRCLPNVMHRLRNGADIIINLFQENGIDSLVLRRVVVTKKNHYATIKDHSVTAWVVALVDLTSKVVVVIKNHRAISRAMVARVVVVIETLLMIMMVMVQWVWVTLLAIMVTAHWVMMIVTMVMVRCATRVVDSRMVVRYPRCVQVRIDAYKYASSY
jgi:hypothetical protein